MNKYLFSYQNTYKETCYILSHGNNRKQAKEKINIPCTYQRMIKDNVPKWMIDLTYY